MNAAPHVTLLPLLGALHLRFPRYNAVVVEELLAAARPDVVALEPLAEGYERDAFWRDTDELLLPWVVVPWAERRGVPAPGVHEPPPLPGAAHEFERYLGAYPQGRTALEAVAVHERPLPEVLARPLTLEDVAREVLPPLSAAREARLAAFGDGPATEWAEARAEAVAARVLALGAERPLLALAVDRFAAVREALRRRGATAEMPSSPPPSEAARRRALLDVAWRGEAADVGTLVARLRELGNAEARYHAANLLLEHGHAAEALDELEAIMRLEFASPPFLPGLVLARLGQLRDLAGRRDDALRAYRGALALSWAPLEAREAARAGMETPFDLP